MLDLHLVQSTIVQSSVSMKFEQGLPVRLSPDRETEYYESEEYKEKQRKFEVISARAHEMYEEIMREPDVVERKRRLKEKRDEIRERAHEPLVWPDGTENDDYMAQYAEFMHYHLYMKYRGTSIWFTFFVNETLGNLIGQVEDTLQIPMENQKYMVTPKIGTLKYPFDLDMDLEELRGKKIILFGTSEMEVEALKDKVKALARHDEKLKSSPIKSATPARTRDWRKIQNESTYTFHTIRALDYLPNPGRSHNYLERLAADPGIKAAMTAHKFTVGMLTEMNPAEHTTHDSRTLGLNRNRGEVIELRLRTDAYDGYRDYKTIRKTLCHELAHNVYGDHDRNFYNLMQQIEKEVEKADWTRGGRSVGEEEFYNPNDGGVPEGDHFDGGGWTGGEFVLGRGEGASAAEGSLSRREVMAKAAEERAKKLGKPGGGAGGSSGSGGASGSRSV